MKRFIPLLIVLAVACSTRDQESQSQTNTITAFRSVDPSVKLQIATFLTDYLELSKMLIEDSLAGAKTAASAFNETTRKFNIEKLSPEQLDFYLIHSSYLKTSLEAFGKSDNIEKARVELATVSSAMYAMCKAVHPNNSPLYYQYCPMARDNKGANWISTTKELVNPYMGQMMLACGRTQEILE
jgi:Cu(I)/Ag(I) efflux system membrane fusion protein